jgi:hypothetical protein
LFQSWSWNKFQDLCQSWPPAPGAVPAPSPVLIPAPGIVPVPAPGAVPTPGADFLLQDLGQSQPPAPGAVPAPSPILSPAPGAVPVPSPGTVPAPGADFFFSPGAGTGSGTCASPGPLFQVLCQLLALFQSQLRELCQSLFLVLCQLRALFFFLQSRSWHWPPAPGPVPVRAPAPGAVPAPSPVLVPAPGAKPALGAVPAPGSDYFSPGAGTSSWTGQYAETYMYMSKKGFKKGDWRFVPEKMIQIYSICFFLHSARPLKK